MSVVSGLYFLWVGGRGQGVPLVYECCKIVVV